MAGTPDSYYNPDYSTIYSAIDNTHFIRQFFTNLDGTLNFNAINNYIGAKENGISDEEIFSTQGQKDYLGNQNPTAKYKHRSKQDLTTNVAPAVEKIFSVGKQATDAGKQATDAGEQALDGTKKTDWGGILSGAGDVMAGLGALGSVGLGIWQGIENQKNMREQLDLARENFNFQKGLANRNIANSARQINEQVAARAGLADAYGARNGSDADRYNKAHRVDGSPIG